MKNNKIKDLFLRNFSFIFNYNCYYIFRRVLYYFRFIFSFRVGKIKHTDTLFFVIDHHKNHPGLADRLKAIISAYNEAKFKGLYFKLIFNSPFNLEEYLLPTNTIHDWRANESDLEYVIGKTHFVVEHSNWNITVEKGHQYHCYFYSGNDLPVRFDNSGYKWYDLFMELFRPSDDIMNALESIGLEPKTYCAVHLRFVNALENFEFGYYNSLQTDDEKAELINRCKKAILSIVEKVNQKVVVFSDSKLFLTSLNDLPVIVLDPENVGHISISGNKSESVTKTFLDMFVISRASKVYKIKAPELYKYSDFALCSARMGDAEFEEINA